MELKNTRTEQNLMTAFSAESQARNKYTLFADKARKDGFLPAANLFKQIADNEKAHSEIWLTYLNTIGTTEQNRSSSIAGEHYEWAEMYRSFAETARDEGFDDIAVKMEAIGQIEAEHEKCFSALLENMSNQNSDRCGDKMIWQCSNCGHIHTGQYAPKICPVCGRDQSYFVQKPTNS